IKDVVVKTIISSEPYVTSLLKMYVRRPYSCHELFGFDIMLDENLKPWVLEVNISPSLHSNSPLDISIKGQMIRDLLNLAGFVLPNAEDIISSPSSCSSSTTSLPTSPGDKCRMAPEHVTAQKMKKAYYLTQKIPDQDFYASVLDVLTPDDVRILVEMEDEFSRRGVDLLRSWCYKGFHVGVVSDSAPVWSLPTSLLTISKDDVILNAFSKSETSKLGKHSSCEVSLLLSEDGTTPKSKKTQAGLSP
ncbi:TTLL4 isoform 20, partial [Pongo abelii]